MAFILEVVDRQGTATYEALAEWMQVSTMTVRRDCEELVRLGKIIKTIGGIQQAHAPAYLYEDPVLARIATNRAEKRSIAAKALEVIPNQQTIFIDGGTTNLALARLLASQRTGLTILTNSALTCLELSKSQNRIIGIGGEYDPVALSFVGSQAEEMADLSLSSRPFSLRKVSSPWMAFSSRRSPPSGSSKSSQTCSGNRIASGSYEVRPPRLEQGARHLANPASDHG